MNVSPASVGSPHVEGARRALAVGLVAWGLGNLLVLVGFAFGQAFLPREPPASSFFPSAAGPFVHWDGRHYADIVRHGYRFEPDAPSNVAFFPLFPALGWGLSQVGPSPEVALALVAQLSLLAACCLLALLARLPGGVERDRALGPDWALVAFLVWPPAMFARMAYTESLFLALSLGLFVVVRRQGPASLAAGLAGLLSATRVVGLAAAPVVFWYAWKGRGLSLVRSLAAAAASCWGLLAYMAYQGVRFKDPLAFARTQTEWVGREFGSWREQLWSLATAEPIRRVFDPADDRYWGLYFPQEAPLFNITFLNPVYFLAAAGLVAAGAAARKLDVYETLFAVGVLAIPYVTHAHISGMMSQARFTCVAFPLYLLLGHVLARSPAAVAALVAGLGATLTALYAALFATWYRMF